MQEILKELILYAQQHFEDEEKLMVEKDVDTRHIEKHVTEHNSFLDYVLMLTGEQPHQVNPLACLSNTRIGSNNGQSASPNSKKVVILLRLTL